MQSLGQLNSVSSADVSMQIENLIVRDIEGATVLMPLMAWTPVHDLGGLTGNGVQITHTFSPGNIIMSDGQQLTPAQYANVPLNKPTTATTGNVWTTTSPNKFVAQSIGFNDPNDSTSQPQAAVLINMTNSAYNIAGDFCIEYWHYPISLSSNLKYPFVYTNLFGTATTPRIGLGYAVTPSSPQQVWHRLNLDSGAYDVYINNINSYLNAWHHFAIVRLGNNVRVFIDGALVTFGNATSPPTSVSVIPNTTDYSHIADYIRLGSKDNATNWGFPDGSTNNASNGYLGQVRFSNVARYTTTASITVPTAAFTNPDANTVFLVQAENGNIVDKANTYATNRVLEIPTLSLRGGSPNVSLTNSALNTYVIKNIRTPEDYFAADLSLVFARDYSGVGNPDEPGTLNWSTNIRNLDVATYDFTYNVQLQLTNEAEVTNSTLGDLLYNYYGNTIVDIANVVTNFNNTTQTTQILDSENTANENYSVTITTQHHPALVVLDTTTTANIAKYFGYAGNVPGANGRLSMTGTKSDINDALNLLTFTKNDYVSNGQNKERPNSRNVVGKNWSQTRNPSTGAITEVFSSPNITTGQTATPPALGINYCLIPNNQDAALGNSQDVNLLIPNLGTILSPYQDASWNACDWGSVAGAATHEFWIYIDDATKKCNIHVSGICLSLYGGKLWMAWDSAIPGVGPLADLPGNKPRRIEHNTTVTSGTWYHVAMIYNTGTWKFYVNGQDNSTVFTGGNTTTAVANEASGFLRFSSLSWQYGGLVPLVNNTPGQPGYRIPGFSGRLAQIRWSRVVRYTANFTPPSRLFTNDFYTVYLHQFNTTLAQDDASLPQMSGTPRVLTWDITNPIGTTMATLAQNYYPTYGSPVYDAMDMNYVAPAAGMYRHAFAGLDVANNPVFVYGFRDDQNTLSVRVNRLSVATGTLIAGPVTVISNISITNPTIQVISMNEGVNLRQGLIASQVPTAVTTGGNQVLFGNINLETGQWTSTGNITSPQTNITECIAYNFRSNLSANLFGICTANATASMFDNRVMPDNQGNTMAVQANIVSQVNMVGFPGVTQNRVIKVATGLSTTAVPRYQLTLTSGSTDPNQGNFGSGLMFPSVPVGTDSSARVRSISLNQERNIDIFYENDNRFLWAMRTKDLINTAQERIIFKMRAGRFDDNVSPQQQLGTEVTGDIQQQIGTRIGGFDIVPGATKNRAWMVYNQDNTIQGGSSGMTNNTASGFWYMGINISDSYVVSYDIPVQVLDPAVTGAIYRPSLTAQSTAIGAYTYIHTIVGSVSSDQPYVVTLKIPN